MDPLEMLALKPNYFLCLIENKPDSDPADIPDLKKIDNARNQPDYVLIIEEDCPKNSKKEEKKLTLLFCRARNEAIDLIWARIGRADVYFRDDESQKCLQNAACEFYL